MNVAEFESEPVKGIPGILPAGERVLWQGTPTWRSLFVHVMHVRWVAAYFGLIMAWRAYRHMVEGNGIEVAASSAAWLGVLGLVVMAMLGGVALLMKRTTIYTLTSQRIILRYGMVVPLAINVPFAKIEAVDVKAFSDGTGEIPLSLSGPDQFVYWMMWPHARRWHFMDPKPMLRSVPDAIRVAGMISNAIAATVTAGEATASAPVRAPQRAPSVDTSGSHARPSGAMPAVA
jgi:hypothetical protein